MVVGGDGADGVVRAFLRSFYCSKSKRLGSMFIPKKSKSLEFQKSQPTYTPTLSNSLW